jgi:hypothetical protein
MFGIEEVGPFSRTWPREIVWQDDQADITLKIPEQRGV